MKYCDHKILKGTKETVKREGKSKSLLITYKASCRKCGKSYEWQEEPYALADIFSI
jgi:predicted Zn-ribbon and HTH transcriptional regulator